MVEIVATHHEIIAVLQCDGTIEIGEEDELGVLEGESERLEVDSGHDDCFEGKSECILYRCSSK